MIAASSMARVRSDPLLPLDTRLGPVRIAVSDRERALSVWQDVVGLDLVAAGADTLVLGVGGEALIVLETGAVRPVEPRTVGLYHVAIHVPQRADLAAMAARALLHRVRIAPTDHLVSEAVYLWDHDGNGIEITFETPWRGTLGDPDRGGGYAVTTDGRPHSGREAIDLQALLSELDDQAAPKSRLPDGTRIGHIHLHVTDLDRAMAFYRDVVGFGGLLLIRSFGMGDVGLDYMPHTVAFNIWSGPDALLPRPGSAGLRWFTLVVPDEDARMALAARLAAAGTPLTPRGEGWDTADPFGNRIRIEAR